MTLTLRVISSEPGTVYAAAFPVDHAGPAPSAIELRTSASSAWAATGAAAGAGVATILGGEPAQVQVEGSLRATTSYTVYLAVEDGVGNLQPVLADVAATTVQGTTSTAAHSMDIM